MSSSLSSLSQDDSVVAVMSARMSSYNDNIDGYLIL